MAEDVCNNKIPLKKNCKITVRVDEVLPDIVVVSFTFQGKLFQGVLLDSSKKLLPCGITPPSYIQPPLGSAVPTSEDKLFSASQRYSYFQAKPADITRQESQPKTSRIKTARMTVRLRPRQVLCSKCRGICNENSENVGFQTKKRKTNDEPEIQTTLKLPKSDRRLGSSRTVLNSTEKDNSQSIVPESKETKLSFTPLTPKQPEQSANDENINSKVQKLKIVGRWGKSVEEKESGCTTDTNEGISQVELPVDIALATPPCIDVESEFDETDDVIDGESNSNVKRIPRKKRSVGLMEDLWDENVFEESSKNLEKKIKTPIIKISFGSTGEGTIVKIPPKIQNVPPINIDDAEKTRRTKDASAKAAKKALKKAKKEARKKMVSAASPRQCQVGITSPRYPNLSPRYFVACASPHRQAMATLGAVSPAYEVFHKKHKHKVKHKKRHKEDKKNKIENENTALPTVDSEKLSEGALVQDENNEDKNVQIPPESIQECLKQKLSISLKRLSATAYTRLSTSSSSSPSHSDASDEFHSDAVPDFPNPNPTVMMRLAASATQSPISSCETSDGRLMAVGDVVWGKIHGFPWWPGKVTAITIPKKDEVISSPQAHVSWYGSSTSSLISCDQLNPFLETFQMRYNKKKRGPYKEAIKQATTEAKRGDIPLPSPDIYMSPEVDVMS